MNRKNVFFPAEQHTQKATQEEMLVPTRVQKNKQGIVLGPIIGILTVRRRGRPSFRGNRANADVRSISGSIRNCGSRMLPVVLAVVARPPIGLIATFQKGLPND